MNMMAKTCSSCGASGAMCIMSKVAWVLVVVGALNWGLVGVADFNVVSALFGAGSTIEMIIYILIGISALAMLVGCRCKTCKPESAGVPKSDGAMK